ncbi:hypothetical protein [Undibacterium terreum]|uniref:hypothetical protein n=1 Tax=Undibacterium terreum TaxID=1224302 RepID=UPI00166E5BF5|nr:hypothetical protein [Undibacterium terreum]
MANHLSLVAGNIGSPGYVDGLAGAARFSNAGKVAIDSLGNTVVVEGMVLRKITPSGQVSLLAGGGPWDPESGLLCKDGSGATVSFGPISSLAAGNNGDIYVIDSCGQVRKVTSAGTVTTVANNLRYGTFSGLTFDKASSNLYLTVQDGWVNNTYLQEPLVLQISPGGAVSTLAGKPGVTGYADGQGGAALFGQPSNIMVDGAGNLFVNDCINGAIRKIDKNATVSSIVAPTSNLVHCPSQLMMEASGNLVLVDGVSGISRISPQGQMVSTMPLPVIANNDFSGNPYYPPSTKLWERPMTLDSSGNIVFGNFTAIDKISSTGVVSTLAGTDIVSGDQNGAGQLAQFRGPHKIVADAAGNLYEAHVDQIRKITPAGVVSTFVKGGPQAGFTSAFSLAMDPAGNIIAIDYSVTFPQPGVVQTQQAIKKISPSGAVSTLYSTVDPVVLNDVEVDGSGTIYVLTGANAVLKLSSTGQLMPYLTLNGQTTNSNYFAIDSQGAVYTVVTSPVNSTLHKVTPQGTDTVLATIPGPAAGAIILDAGGNLFLADSVASVLRVTPQGTVSRYLGSGTNSGTQLGAGPGGLWNPVGLAISGTTLYITAGNALLATGQ